MKLILVTFLLFFSHVCFAEPSELYLKEGSAVSFAPPVINKRYFLLEYGFIIQKNVKSWNYTYNAYVSGALFQDWLRKEDKLRAGGLGFKGGILLPLGFSFPLLAKVGGGYAKTVLHKDPIFGSTEKIAGKKDMFLLEAGLLYFFNPMFLTITYQQSNVGYFDRHLFLSVGVNY